MIIVETCPVCGSDLFNLCYATFPPVHSKYCMTCGWHWEESPQEVRRVPFTIPEEQMPEASEVE